MCTDIDRSLISSAVRTIRSHHCKAPLVDDSTVFIVTGNWYGVTVRCRSVSISIDVVCSSVRCQYIHNYTLITVILYM